MNATVYETEKKAAGLQHNLKEQRAHLIDTGKTELLDLRTVGTHNIIKIPKGKMLTGGHMVILTAAASAGAATAQLKVGAVALTSAIAKADLTANKVIPLVVPAAGGDVYAVDADKTIDLVVGTAALTALKVLVFPEFMDINTTMTRG